ncbi:uncharacterized protein BJ212DRAFT_1326898 [Suillus subaureus]|uniref:Uncharacterized protein n=1 Tax=Suillus subaureus TaxID=48587 RepID=A0A9P7EK83_9AGAM|nr:uncharacterized protein BJ212DRAFT_1326898 [Suillus subaureus]KAG1823836.1 hypothetical protein BJ212DRAFT_1326898 [Suillus subaureus]
MPAHCVMSASSPLFLTALPAVCSMKIKGLIDKYSDGIEDVRKVLNYLSKPTLHMSRMEFHGVGAREFEFIAGMVGETGRVSTKPRLAYDYNTHVLIVNMPTVLHQVSFDDVRIFVSDFIHDLPYDPEIICPMLDTSLMLEIADGSIMPDMAMTVTAVEGPTEVVLIPFVAECALSETDEHVFEKAEDIILAYPDVICIAVMLVREAREYAAPDYRDSTVPTALCGGTDSDPKPLTLKQFINLRTTPRSFGEPTVIGDHTWCHLSSVEYFVWVKRDDGSPIDIRSQDPGDMAYGIVMPEIDMDAVTEMLERGLTKVRDSFVAFQKELEPSVDCTALAESEVRCRTNWRLVSKRLFGASDVTAHKRYLAWHKKHFGTGSAESSYVDSEQADEGEEPVVVATSKRKRACASALPCSRYKIKKS